MLESFSAVTRKRSPVVFIYIPVISDVASITSYSGVSSSAKCLCVLGPLGDLLLFSR